MKPSFYENFDFDPCKNCGSTEYTLYNVEISEDPYSFWGMVCSNCVSICHNERAENLTKWLSNLSFNKYFPKTDVAVEFRKSDKKWLYKPILDKDEDEFTERELYNLCSFILSLYFAIWNKKVYKR
jgi:hypothetical protein